MWTAVGDPGGEALGEQEDQLAGDGEAGVLRVLQPGGLRAVGPDREGPPQDGLLPLLRRLRPAEPGAPQEGPPRLRPLEQECRLLPGNHT